MKIEIVYDSSTGTTRQAAQAMGNIFTGKGHRCRVQSVSEANPGDMREADLICIGGWVQGLFIVMQHPSGGAMYFIDRLGDLSGKEAIVFCTYKIATGPTLSKMARALQEKGAKVLGQFKYRGPVPNSAFESFATSMTIGE